ncbi:MAG: SCP2 sterol-binding domain-containing protein [Deltaproteobacteria bacterium]|nr:SCP2 sterol-binding domain-containing protein [Deltaproteobacteria bacterium]
MDGHEMKGRLKALFYKGAVLSLKAMPLWLEAIGAGAFFAAVTLKNPGLKERLNELEGRVFRFEARDIGKGFYLAVKDGEASIVPHMTGLPDVVMKGDVEALAGLLLGKEDPDTVFFSRRLEVSGDTAIAVHFKNILSSIS